jgi:hypothetical protein
MIVDTAIKDRKLTAQHITEEFLTVQDTSGGAQECSKKVKLGGRQFDDGSAAPYRPSASIQNHIGHR